MVGRNQRKAHLMDMAEFTLEKMGIMRTITMELEKINALKSILA